MQSPLPGNNAAGITGAHDVETVSPTLRELVTKIVSETIMQIQPVIMNSVSQACSKTLSMFLEQTKQNTPVLPSPQATTPLQNSLALDIKKQLRQQAYIKDQIEQDNKSNIIRIKGVTPESADLRQTIINLANDVQVRLHTNDIIIVQSDFCEPFFLSTMRLFFFFLSSDISLD